MNTKDRTKKKVAIIVAVLALFVTTMTGTFAYVDYSQHKSNEFSGSSPKYEARLVEDFNEVTDWKYGDCPVTKKISVANLGQAPEYGDVYIRIQLKEYMEIGALTYIQTTERYMIDTTGEYVIYPDENSVRAAVATGGKYAGHGYTYLTDAVTGKTGYFIKTQDHDPNGQMGKYVVTSATVGDPVAVISSGPQQRAASTNHEGGSSAECDYAIHSWKTGSDLETREYISWQLNTNAIITVTQWLDPAGPYKGAPVGKWIIDDTNDDGWVYWGRALQTESSTALFMESVSLLKQPEGSFYYVIHTDMQAVSLDELVSGDAQWGDIGQKIAGI